MDFGVAIPNCTEGLMHPVSFASPRALINIAQKVESFGYDSVWVNDHFTTQKYLRSKNLKPNFYEPFITLSTVAALTDQIKLGSMVTVLPLRDPVLLAKQATTLDVFSDGRLILGVGLGAYREEFEAVKPLIPSNRRGTIMDESLQAMRELLTRTPASFDGTYIKFLEVELYPRPIQKPLPIWVCGNSPKGIKRAAKWGNGWSPCCVSAEEIKEGASKLRDYTDQVGGDFSEISVAPEYYLCIDKDFERAMSKFRSSRTYKHLLSLKNITLKGQPIETYERNNLIGTPNTISDQIEKFIEAGAVHMPLIPLAETIEEFLEQIKLFSKEVIPSFKN